MYAYTHVCYHPHAGVWICRLFIISAAELKSEWLSTECWLVLFTVGIQPDDVLSVYGFCLFVCTLISAAATALNCTAV